MQRTLLSVSVEPSLKAITINLKEHFKNPSSVPLVGRYGSATKVSSVAAAEA